MSEIELKARKLLAAEYRKLGIEPQAARLMEQGHQPGGIHYAAVQTIAAALSPQWQPIETADATTPVLTFGPDGMKIAFYYDGSWVEQCGDELFCIDRPTIWQPLPAAPEVSA